MPVFLIFLCVSTITLVFTCIAFYFMSLLDKHSIMKCSEFPSFYYYTPSDSEDVENAFEETNLISTEQNVSSGENRKSLTRESLTRDSLVRDSPTDALQDAILSVCSDAGCVVPSVILDIQKIEKSPQTSKIVMPNIEDYELL